MLKRLVGLCGSVIVAGIDRFRAAIRGLLGLPARSTCVVLAYHAVAPRERTRFARQMDDVLRLSKPVPADLVDIPQDGGRYVAITFDDGLENIIENALPELKVRKIPATLFIVTDVLGKRPAWEYFGGADPANERAMTEQQLRDLDTDYLLIGSHSATHPVLPALDDQELGREIVGSRSKLESLLNREVKLLSFPYGYFDQRVINRCRDANYVRVFTALPVLAMTTPREFVTGRVGVNPTDWP